MKLNLIAAVLLCGSVAMAAETSTTAPATTEAQQAAPTKKAVKKAAKKSAKKSGTAQTEQAAPQASAQTQSAAVAAAPAGTSTATAQPAAPTKKWGVTVYQESSMDYANGKKDLDQAVINTNNYVGASYKITANEKVSFKQYYMYDYDPTSEKEFESSDINQSFGVLGLSTKTAGILGSEAVAPAISWWLPNHSAEETNFGRDLHAFNGILRGDAEIAWTLNPKWSVSYYLSPRQTMGGSQKWLDDKGKEKEFFATTRLVHLANLYYNVSDETQVYANIGMDNRMKSSTLTSTSDDYLSALGASVGFFGGKLTLNPEISVTSSLKKKGVAERSQNLYKKDNVAYMLATVIAL